jgi:hypothetical protein
MKKEENSFFCTAVEPRVELDFDNPSEPGINGNICKLPAPAMAPSEPWDICKRYKSK